MLHLNYVDRYVLDYFKTFLDLTDNTVFSDVGTAGLIEPALVRQHFLCYTFFDVLYFCHFYRHLLKNQGSNVFSAIGFNPCTAYLLQLKQQFPQAKTITVFDDDLLGRVLDCKVLLAYIGKELRFKLYHDRLLFRYKSKDFAVPESNFTLHRFMTLTGIRSHHRTIKPKGAVSFALLLTQQNSV